jgi:FkbM family methyltransferase
VARSLALGLSSLKQVPAASRGEVARTLVRFKRTLMAAALTGKPIPAEENVLGSRFTSGDSYEHLDLVFEEIFVLRCYDVPIEPPAGRPVRIVDCGANVGMSIAFFKHTFPSCEIIAFEPDPATFRHLEGNVGRSFSGVELHRVALGAEDAVGALASTDANSLLRQVVLTADATGADTVDIRRLSPFLPEQVDLLKLDVEGAELGILRELDDSGSLPRIANIVAEFHHESGMTGEGSGLPEFLSILDRNGFRYQVDTVARRISQLGTRQDILVRAWRS